MAACKPVGLRDINCSGAGAVQHACAVLQDTTLHAYVVFALCFDRKQIC